MLGADAGEGLGFYGFGIDVGGELDVLCGLGNGFDPDKCGNNPVVVGGGVGVPPMYGVAKALIEKGKKVLLDWYPNIKKVGFASPHSDIVRSFVDDNRKRYEQMGFSYVIGGRNFDNWRLFKRGISWVARKTKSPKVFGFCYDTSMNEKKDFYLYAVPVHKLTTLDQVIYLVERCVKQKKWLVLEFHGIDTADSKEYQEEFCWLEDDFIKLCQHIKDLEIKGKIKIVNPIDFVCSEG